MPLIVGFFILYYITPIRDIGTNSPMMPITHFLYAVDGVITANFS